MYKLKFNYKYFIISIVLLIPIITKFIFPSNINSYFFYIFFSFFFLIFFNKRKKIAIFIFILLFFAGSHKEIQKKYYKFMSIMHWNDGVKVIYSLFYNLIRGNYKKNFSDFLLEDKGNNSGINEVEEIKFLIKKHFIIEYHLSNSLLNDIKKNRLFFERLREVTYPAKIKNLSKKNSSVKNKYYYFSKIKEETNLNCNYFEKLERIRLDRCY